MFKIGDRVRLINNNLAIGKKGKEGIIMEMRFGTTHNEFYVAWDLENPSDSSDYLWLDENYLNSGFEIIKYNKNMNTLTSTIKRLFNKKKQLQYKAGFIDNCGVLTSLGKEEFESILQDAHEDAFTAAAVERIKEEKEEKEDK